MSQWSRRKTVAVDIGGVKVGSAHPVVVQSMTNTDTADVGRTVEQVTALAEAGSELVRVNRLAPDHVDLYVKAEAFNPAGSVKDRLAVSIIEEAEKELGVYQKIDK